LNEGLAARAAGLTDADTRKAQENALEIAFLSDDEKKTLVHKSLKK